MFERFTKKPFKDRIKDTGYLLKNSFTIIRRDRDIKTPAIHMAVFSSIITTFIFISILTFFFESLRLYGLLLLLFTLFILIPFRYFYDVRQKANQSWIVYNTLIGNNISYNEAHEHTSTQKANLRFIAFVNILSKHSANTRKNNRGIKSIIINLFLAALREIWDLLSHYMIPAVVIEQRPLKELIPKIKDLKKNVPAIFAGVFGIEFVGSVVGGLLLPIYLLFFIISLILGYAVSLVTQTTVITIGNFSFSWVPVLIMLYVVMIIAGIYQKFIESIKVIYFTIFYTTLTRPSEITPNIRKEVTHYLLMKE